MTAIRRAALHFVCAIDDFDDIEPNAAHIAAFNPELILRLLDVVEAAGNQQRRRVKV